MGLTILLCSANCILCVKNFKFYTMCYGQNLQKDGTLCTRSVGLYNAIFYLEVVVQVISFFAYNY